ncbi:MAG: thioredoxin family protein [Leptospiraceae bacterium]|nr:thioredoxin family protein [Leptospiraceae bacterium]
MASSAKYKFSIPTLDNNEYNQQMESGKKIAVAFNATWCPACMAQLKALDSLLPKYNSKISIFAYDWDAIDTFAGPKVNQRTTIAIFQNGKIIDELIGETRAEKIASFLDKNTKK